MWQSSSVGVQPEEFQILEAQLSNGGCILSVHSPDSALVWLEEHYSDHLLKKIRAGGLGGPIAGMLSSDTQALVLFGSILDDWVLKAAKLLADESGFTVMIQPLTDDPIKKWSLAERSSLADISKVPGDREQDESVSDHDEDQHSIGTTSEDTDSDTEYLNNQQGVFRLRGGATRSDKSTPWMGPVHDFDIHLEFREKQMTTSSVQPKAGDQTSKKVSIQCKLQVPSFQAVQNN
jgi:hypothetical protein